MIRWNANFVRGLAESVLERARKIRGTLVTQTKQRKRKKAAVKRARTPRRPNG